MRRKLLLIAAGLAMPAQAQLVLHGSSRLRYEAIAGQPRAGFDDRDGLVNLRTILGAGYGLGPVRLEGELWDSRAWGADRGTPLSTGEVDALEPVQLNLSGEIAGAFGRGSRLELRAGRMLLDLGSRRLVAADDYRNTTNGFTGLRGDLALAGGTGATLVYVLPQRRLPDDPDGLRADRVRLDRESFATTLWGGTLIRAKAIGPVAVELSYLRFDEHDRPGRPTRDRALASLGGRAIRDPAAGALDGEVEVIHQTGGISAGLDPTAARLPVSAWFLHAELGYTAAGGWRPHVSAEFDHAGGDRRGGRYGRFDPLFGMRRGDLAPAGLYNAVARTNLLAPGVRLEVAPTGRLDAFVAWRSLWLAARADAFSTSGVRDPAGRSGRFAGHQAEGRVRWWLIPSRLRAEVDALWLGKGAFLRDAPNAPTGGNTRYVSLNLTAGF